jgi:hypothetical protein
MSMRMRGASISIRRVIVVAIGALLAASCAIGCSSADSSSDVDADRSDAADAGAMDGADHDANVAPPRDASHIDADATTSDASAIDAPVDATPDAPGDAPADAALDAPIEADPPALAALSVTALASDDAGSTRTLVPAFSPDVHDYAIRCTEGTNAITVSMTATPGSSTLLISPDPSPSLPQQTLTVDVTENQAIIAAATDNDATNEYWIRCLPHDFPLTQWTPHPDVGTPSPGYYMIGTAIPTTSGCYAMVLDSHGTPVWYTQSTPQPGLGWCVFDVDAVVPGAITFDAVDDSPTQFELHPLDLSATTKIAPAGSINVDLHDLRLLANGDYLVLSSPVQTGVNLAGLQIPLGDGGVETLSGSQPIAACNLVEFKPDGTVVWTWSATDHFDAVADSIEPTFLPIASSSNLVVDPFHCNAVDVDPGNGNLLVSAREMNSIFYIERSTGHVLWKMGGAQASKDGATYISVADPFALQHDVRLQPDWSSTCNGGSGHISIFDDEIAGGSAPARAVVYDVVVGADDGGTASDGGCKDGGSNTAPGTATVAWQRAGAGPSAAMGSFRIDPDGSRVIGWGLVPGAGFTEVDADGNALLDMTFADENSSYRAIKVPTSTFDLDALRRMAGVP